MLKSISAALTVGLLAFGIGNSAVAASAHSSATIVASNWKFTPGIITVHQNQVETLRLTSKSGVHGIEADNLGIASTTIVPGKFVTVTFKPKKIGTYPVHCAIFCGAGHAHMVLIVKVIR